MYIGEVISYNRQQRGLSQNELAMFTNRSQRFISDVERGRQDPDAMFLNQVALYFSCEVTAAYICGIRDKELIDAAVEDAVTRYKQTGEVVKIYA